MNERGKRASMIEQKKIIKNELTRGNEFLRTVDDVKLATRRQLRRRRQASDVATNLIMQWK
jgi:hypothetical protein